MIVASLLLILAAVTLLVLGLANGSSPLLVGSIAASLLAAIALVIGARQAAAARAAADGYRGRADDERDAGETMAHRAPVRERATADVPDQRVGGRTATTEAMTEPIPVVPANTAPAGMPEPDMAGSGAPHGAGGPYGAEPYAAEPYGAEPYGAEPYGADMPAEMPPGPPPGSPVGGPPGVPPNGAVDAHPEAPVSSEAGEIVDDEDPPDEPAPQLVTPADAARVARMSTEVLVIDGRPRYHLAGCVHLLGRDSEPLPVGEAVELGFSPCSLCEPDSALLAEARR